MLRLGNYEVESKDLSSSELDSPFILINTPKEPCPLPDHYLEYDTHSIILHLFILPLVALEGETH